MAIKKWIVIIALICSCINDASCAFNIHTLMDLMQQTFLAQLYSSLYKVVLLFGTIFGVCGVLVPFLAFTPVCSLSHGSADLMLMYLKKAKK